MSYSLLKALEVLLSYLQDRWQRVKINTTFSSWTQLLQGVHKDRRLKLLIFLRFFGLKVACIFKIFGAQNCFHCQIFLQLKVAFIFKVFGAESCWYFQGFLSSKLLIFSRFWGSKLLIFSRFLRIKVAYIIKVFGVQSCSYFQDFWGSKLLNGCIAWLCKVTYGWD